jgi:hypothetical protein
MKNLFPLLCLGFALTFVPQAFAEDDDGAMPAVDAMGNVTGAGPNSNLILLNSLPAAGTIFSPEAPIEK